MDTKLLRPALSNAALELIPIVCMGGIAALFGAAYAVSSVGLVSFENAGVVLLPIVFLAVATMVGGVGWFVAGRDRVGVAVLGSRVALAVAVVQTRRA